MGTESLEGIVKLAKHVLYITGIIELLGAIVLSIRFVPKYGFFKGMWFSIFHSVSAFCNAGFDIIGDGKKYAFIQTRSACTLYACDTCCHRRIGFLLCGRILSQKNRGNDLTCIQK